MRERGHDAIHIHDHPGRALDDRAIFEFARRHQYVIITTARLTASDIDHPPPDRRGGEP
ncbi:DUF5615 family PIN-like protein [Candidatus Nitrospira inopinata]|uniref:DUF5615 family PIN-like protein n=1 Tax=Candidatus Nitrospira inopinata TaxID=1715989 RepID=UPI0038B368AD